jgi:hypothetical protein
MMCGSILDSQFAGHLGRLALADIVIIIKNRPFYDPFIFLTLLRNQNYCRSEILSEMSRRTQRYPAEFSSTFT